MMFCSLQSGTRFVPSPACGGGLGRGHERRFGPICPLPNPPPQAGEGAHRASGKSETDMASLKDMRVRIAATKATQKITKAMQMVAASKLRRAQVAAEAARPYADRMGKVLGNIAAYGRRARHRAGAAARYRQQPDASAARLHRRARPVRAVQLGDRPACPRACQCADRRRQDGQILLCRPQGLRADSPQLRKADHRASRTARARHHVRACRGGRRKDRQALRGRRVRRLHAVLLALQVGHRADPDRAPAHPAGVREATKPEPPAAHPTSTSRRKKRFWPSSCRATSRCRSSARSWRTLRPSTARR